MIRIILIVILLIIIGVLSYKLHACEEIRKTCICGKKK